MQRKTPSHIIKMYEALWCVWDGRVELIDGESGIIAAQVKSSDGSKIYDVSYDQLQKAIMSNDNSSYWKNELWYPALALLLFLDVLDYQSDYGEALSDIPWKSINTINSNNRNLTQQQIDEKLRLQGVDILSLHDYCDGLMNKLNLFSFDMLGEMQDPDAILV